MFLSDEAANPAGQHEDFPVASADGETFLGDAGLCLGHGEAGLMGPTAQFNSKNKGKKLRSCFLLRPGAADQWGFWGVTDHTDVVLTAAFTRHRRMSS